MTIKDYLLEKGINPLYIDEIIKLNVNIFFNQNTDEINVSAGFTAIIGSIFPIFEIEGGNDLIINKLADKLIGKVKSSESCTNGKVKIFKNAEVLKVERNENSKFILNYKIVDSEKIKNLKSEYDIVILASPKEESHIKFPNVQFDLQNIDFIPQKVYYYIVKVFH